MQNKYPTKKLTENSVLLQRITDLDISFPKDYEPNTISNQQRIVDEAIKDFAYQEQLKYDRKVSVPLKPKEKSHAELAQILETPNKLAAVHNSYYAYKQLGGIQLPKFLKKKQKKADEVVIFRKRVMR